MHLHNCRCIQEHVRMLLQSLRALWQALGRPGNVWKYLEALGRATGVSGRFACGFWTNLHFSGVVFTVWWKYVIKIAYSTANDLFCCINRFHTGWWGWFSYGLMGLALIPADGVQPSLHVDKYVCARTIYIWPCGPLRYLNQASSNQYVNRLWARLSLPYTFLFSQSQKEP